MNYLKVAQALVAEFPTLDGAIDNGFDRYSVHDAEKLCGVIQAFSAAEIRSIRSAAQARTFVYLVTWYQDNCLCAEVFARRIDADEFLEMNCPHGQVTEKAVRTSRYPA